MPRGEAAEVDEGPEERAVLGGRREDERHERPDLSDRILLAGHRLAHPRMDRIDQPGEELAEELVLGVEVVERDALGDAGAARDVVEGRLREALLGDLAKRGLQQGEPPFGLRGSWLHFAMAAY